MSIEYAEPAEHFATCWFSDLPHNRSNQSKTLKQIQQYTMEAKQMMRYNALLAKTEILELS